MIEGVKVETEGQIDHTEVDMLLANARGFCPPTRVYMRPWAASRHSLWGPTYDSFFGLPWRVPQLSVPRGPAGRLVVAPPRVWRRVEGV